MPEARRAATASITGMDIGSSLLLFAPGLRFADAVARRLITSTAGLGPDLSALTCVVASPSIAASLPGALARAAGGAVLAPRLLTLDRFALDALPADAAAPLPALACRLRLTEWLGRLRAVYPCQDPARLADALYALFEEFAASAVDLPEDAADFTATLTRGYAAPPLRPLSREAEIVHRLWRAYVEELGTRTPAMTQLLGLRSALAGAQDTLFLGFDALGRAQAQAIGSALREGRVGFWTRGRLEGRDAAATRRLCERLCAGTDLAPVVIDGDEARTPLGALLDAVLDTAADAPARDRAAAIAGSTAPPLALVAASSAEHEARVVDLAVREALLDGARRVVVVSPDRRLARRLRALLERANVGLDDRVGWALSTSRAAAAMACWLECVESGFHFRPLLDLVKTGFFAGESATRPEAALAQRLERCLLLPAIDDTAAPVSGLAAFAALLDGAYAAVFERLRRAALRLPVDAGARPAADWCEAVLDSLAATGLDAGFAADEVGAQLLALLHALRDAFASVPLRLRWPEFRVLLDRHLEDTPFRPAIAGDGPRVTLLTLERTQGLDCDVLILASATRAQLPGSAPGEVFFNQSVRSELGLEGWEARQQLALTRLRGLLQSAPRVLVTWAPERDGDPAQPSPWIEAIAAFARAAGHGDRHDHALAARALRADTLVAPRHARAALPALRPAPSTPTALLRASLSANAHQALVDCPYRWYAGRLLGLAEPDEPDAPAGGRDYGERVHLILQSFHQHVDTRLPPPYSGVRDAAAIPQIEAHLARLADAVFAPDLATRPLARTWRRDFAALQPWLARQLADSGSAAVEVETTPTQPRDGWVLGGRIDRVEHRADGAHVIAYKTGRSVPTNADIEAGEAVQLPHYALALGGAAQLAYWKLRESEPHKRVQAIAEPAELLAALDARLGALRGALESGHPLPAHGDDGACALCAFDGLCRRGSWADAGGGA